MTEKKRSGIEVAALINIEIFIDKGLADKIKILSARGARGYKNPHLYYKIRILLLIEENKGNDFEFITYIEIKVLQRS